MQLTLSEVDHRHGRVQTLAGVSLRLEKGRIGCLLGPSGCGKTTVLRCIAGFEPVAAGEIRADERLLSAPGVLIPPESRGIGMVFQDCALLPHLTVLGNVMFGLRRAWPSKRRARAAAALAAVGLPERHEVYPHQLSGGQRQRVALARALAPRPNLLLLDEPFSNLDAELRSRLTGEVRDILKREQATALLVTHDQHEAFAVADEIGVMRRGRLEQWDTPYNLYHRPASRFVAEFIGRGVFVPGVVRPDGVVEIEPGAIEGSLIEDFPPGSCVDVLLRPDDVAYDPDGPLRAVIARKAFRGPDILYTLRMPSGDELLSLVPSHHDHQIGESIGIRLVADHIVAFKR